MTTDVASITVATAVGVVGVEASETGLTRVRLPTGAGSRLAVGSAGAAARAAAVGAQLAEYAHGERQAFDVTLDWTSVDARHRHVLETLCEIAPYGTSVTYGELGRRAGVDDAREVGVFMATNPVPLVVPCHRVVASDGLGGYGGGLALKQRLLELEGVLPLRLDLGI